MSVKGSKRGVYTHGTSGAYKALCRCGVCVTYMRAQNRDKHNRRKGGRVEWLEVLKAAPCLDCGQQFPPECMDFDHRPGTHKVANVAKLYWHSETTLLEEIAKCDLVCSNCHRIRTRKRQNG